MSDRPRATDDSPEQARVQMLLAVALLTVGAIYVFRGALNLYFAQEDFRGLAVGAGVYPRHDHLWRYVSVQAFMDLFYPVFRDRPWPYHAVSLISHCANATLLFLLLSRHASRSAALIGVSFFAVHPALFTALYWHSARADILAAMFALLTVTFALRSGRERWLAVPLFALSLLSKESTLPLPAVIALLMGWRSPPQPSPGSTNASRVNWLPVVLLTLSLSYVPYLTLPKTIGIGIAFDHGAAYALDFGRSLLTNLLTYVGWTVDLAMMRPGLRFVDRQNPEMFPLAIGVLVGAVALSLWPTLRRRGWLFGWVGFLLLLIPVLPLRNHTYHYYLYVPLLAAALCLTSLVDVVFGRVTSHRPMWALSAICWLALAWNGARLVTEMEHRPSPVYPGLKGDPIVDRAYIAERAISSLRTASIPKGTELVFIMRERIALIARIVRGSGEQPPPPQDVYPETNVKAALFEGVGVRALVPAVDSVSFALELGYPAPHRRYAVYAPTGEVEVFDAAAIDSLLKTSWVTRW